MISALPANFPVGLVEPVLGPRPDGNPDEMRRRADRLSDTATVCRSISAALSARAAATPAILNGDTGTNLTSRLRATATAWNGAADYHDSLALQVHEGANSIEEGQLTWEGMGIVLVAQLAVDAMLLQAGAAKATADRIQARQGWRAFVIRLLDRMTARGLTFTATRSRMLITATLTGGIAGAGVPLIAEALQIAAGHRRGIDLETVTVGGVSGLVGGFTGGLTGMALGPRVDRWLGRRVTNPVRATILRTLALGAGGGAGGALPGTFAASLTQAAFTGDFRFDGSSLRTNLMTGVVGGVVGGTVSALHTGRTIPDPISVTGLRPGDPGSVALVENTVAGHLDGWSDPAHVRDIARVAGDAVRRGRGALALELGRPGAQRVRLELTDSAGETSRTRVIWELDRTPGPVEPVFARDSTPPPERTADELLANFGDDRADHLLANDSAEIPEYQRRVPEVRAALGRRLDAEIESGRVDLTADRVHGALTAYSELYTNAASYSPDHTVHTAVDPIAADGRRGLRITVRNDLAPGQAAELPPWTANPPDPLREGGRGTALVHELSNGLAERVITIGSDHIEVAHSFELWEPGDGTGTLLGPPSDGNSDRFAASADHPADGTDAHAGARSADGDVGRRVASADLPADGTDAHAGARSADGDVGRRVASADLPADGTDAHAGARSADGDVGRRGAPADVPADGTETRAGVRLTDGDAGRRAASVDVPGEGVRVTDAPDSAVTDRRVAELLSRRPEVANRYLRLVGAVDDLAHTLPVDGHALLTASPQRRSELLRELGGRPESGGRRLSSLLDRFDATTAELRALDAEIAHLRVPGRPADADLRPPDSLPDAPDEAGIPRDASADDPGPRTRPAATGTESRTSAANPEIGTRGSASDPESRARGPASDPESGTRESASDPESRSRGSASDPESGTRGTASDPESRARGSASDPESGTRESASEPENRRPAWVPEPDGRNRADGSSTPVARPPGPRDPGQVTAFGDDGPGFGPAAAHGPPGEPSGSMADRLAELVAQRAAVVRNEAWAALTERTADLPFGPEQVISGEYRDYLVDPVKRAEFESATSGSGEVGRLTRVAELERDAARYRAAGEPVSRDPGGVAAIPVVTHPAELDPAVAGSLVADVIESRLLGKSAIYGSGRVAPEMHLFDQWAKSERVDGMPGFTINTVANCIKLPLYAGALGGVIDRGYLRTLTRFEWWDDHLVDRGDGLVWQDERAVAQDEKEQHSRVNRLAMAPHGLRDYGGAGAPPPSRGDLVYFDGLGHVAVATGRVAADGSPELFSFWPHDVWPRPDTVHLSSIDTESSRLREINGVPDVHVEYGAGPWGRGAGRFEHLMTEWMQRY